MVALSTLSGDGSQRSSPRLAAASVSPTAALISPRRPAAGIAVQSSHELEGEVVGAVEGSPVDSLGDVLGAVVVGREQRVVVQAGDRRGPELRQADGERIGRESLAQRLRAEAVAVLAVGRGDRM